MRPAWRRRAAGRRQSHASYGRCGLGSEGTDRLVALVRAEAAAARAAGDEPPLYGAKITGGGSGGAHAVLERPYRSLHGKELVMYGAKMAGGGSGASHAVPARTAAWWLGGEPPLRSANLAACGSRLELLLACL